MKFDMNTRAGRRRRERAASQFNPDTLLPHTAKFVAAVRREKELARAQRKARREFHAQRMRKGHLNG